MRIFVVQFGMHLASLRRFVLAGGIHLIVLALVIRPAVGHMQFVVSASIGRAHPLKRARALRVATAEI